MVELAAKADSTGEFVLQQLREGDRDVHRLALLEIDQNIADLGSFASNVDAGDNVSFVLARR